MILHNELVLRAACCGLRNEDRPRLRRARRDDHHPQPPPGEVGAGDDPRAQDHAGTQFCPASVDAPVGGGGQQQRPGSA
ncbi:MAG: hypothetical protein R2725_05800 [Solirubrobacterales bacterium]